MNFKKPVLHILMEIKSRELEGKTLLALEAARRGFLVIIGHKNDINKGLKIGLLPPGIYFDKSLTKGKEKKLSHIIGMANLLVSQDEEGGLLDKSYDRFLSVRSSVNTVHMANGIFCWGNYDHNAWTIHYPEFIDKIHITGSPRIDYWRPEFKSYFQRHLDSYRKEFGQFVLVSSNFAGANSFMSLKERIDQGKRNSSIRTIEDEQAMKQKIKDSKKMFNKFIELIDFLASRHKQTHFVVRPHPSEKISAWKKNLQKNNNVHVIFEGGISSWVHGSIAVLHNGCTTGMEAYVAGVPAIAYIPFNSSINREIPNRLSIQSTTKEDVSNILSRIIQGEYVKHNRTSENNKLVKLRIANFSGDTAVKRIVDVLEKLNPPLSASINTSFTGWKIGAKKKFKLSLKNILGAETKPMRKFPGLKLHELKQIQYDLSNVTDSYKDCKIRHIYGDIFLIDKK